MKLTPKERLVLPLDIDDIKEAKKIVSELKEYVGVFKLNSLFTNYGREIVKVISDAGCRVFLDLKFHDIPNTIANYARTATRLGAYIFNVHCAGGLDMMRAAAEVARDEAHKLGSEKPIVLGVTVLTSMDQKIMNEELRVEGSVEEQVTHFARLAKKAGLDGVVASAKEVGLIRKACGEDFVVLTPGIRPNWAVADDQKRVVTPSDAIKNGSDFIVIGRPILKAGNRVDAAKKVLKEIGV